jgi:hypothetical protein
MYAISGYIVMVMDDESIIKVNRNQLNFETTQTQQRS